MAMRVTNNMITMRSKSNIGSTKQLVDKYQNQMTNQKKINKPSDDPVVAIRSLRLRKNLSEVNQYYEKNIPDAESWMTETESALENMKTILKDIYYECTYGSNDTLTADDRAALIKNLTSLKGQLYAEGNADYAGRTMFTGYKTNKSLTFLADDSKASYEISQTFSIEDLETKRYYANELSVPLTSDAVQGGIPVEDEMQEVENYRIRLAYDDLKYNAGDEVPLNITGAVTDPATGNQLPAPDKAVVKSYEDWKNSGFAVGDDEVLLIKETGELIFGKNTADWIKTAASGTGCEISLTYNKTGFEKGDVRPEMYFCCRDVTNADDVITYTHENQPIEYGVSANQYLAVNVQASDDGILSTSIAREIDELLEAVKFAQDAHDKVSKLEAMLKEEQYADDASQAGLEEWIAAAKKEQAYADDNVQKLFGAAMTNMQAAQDDVNLAVTDIGSRSDRLDLTKNRMMNQQATVKKLLSNNEDREMSDILIDYKSAYKAYESALSAASKANELTLLDYL